MKILSPTKAAAARPSFSTRELLLHMACWRQEVKKTDASLEKTEFLPPKIVFDSGNSEQEKVVFYVRKKEFSLIYG